MQIGLIADIHGNLIALDTVLQELAQESVDQLICLGDIASLGPQPHEVIDRLRHLHCPVILGNTDARLLTPPIASETDTESTRMMTEIVQWCAGQLDAADRAFIETFPATQEFPLEEQKTLLCFHGSPRSFNDVITATTPDAEVEQMLAGATANIMVGGHTHIQMLRRYKDSFIVNVGSVGLPGVNAGDPALPMNRDVRWAEYGLLRLQQGRLSIDLRRTPLDVPHMLQAARHTKMPHIDWWLQKWATS